MVQEKGRARGLPKGRQVDETSLAEIRTLLQDRDLRRDLLIEHLHLVQDRYGHLAKRHLAALAEIMRLPMAEVYEVATFYAHFHVAEDDQPAPPALVRICGGPCCRMAGSAELAARTAERLGADGQVEVAPCIGRCDRAPAATVTKPGGAFALVDGQDAEGIVQTLRSLQPLPETLPPATLDAYRAKGGYLLLHDCLTGRRSRDSVLDALDAGGLRGLGGAGFPTGRKWRAVLGQPGPRLMAVNADEGEPGTFKDRHLLSTDPHRVLEGMLIGAWMVEAKDVYIYLRDEYPDLHRNLRAEIAAVTEAGLAPDVRIHLRRGAGAYVCGEESSMIESLEGKRGLPRHRPPLVAEKGLFGHPTLVNNVETLWWVRAAIETPERYGKVPLRFYSVSGRVAEPGVKLAPAGVTMRELIEEHCGGMAPGHEFRAYLPGGASGGIFPASLGDLPMDFGSFQPHGGFIGSAGVMVLSQQDDLKALAVELTRFFAEESCGQCTPCRIGTHKAVDLLSRPDWDADLLEELGQVMADGSICGLGQAAPNVWRTLMRHFPQEFERKEMAL